MTWTAEAQREVKRALLGSWPGTITAWGKDAFAAYIGELQARGLEAAQVLTAVRTWPAGSDFPPSAPNLAAAALHDPSVPTFPELLVLLNGPGGILNARARSHKSSWEAGERDRADADAIRERASRAHPLVALFVERIGIDRLRSLGLDDPQFGEARRRSLEKEWRDHVDTMGDRDVRSLASGGRRGELGRLDPLAALPVAPPPVFALERGGEEQ